MAEEALMGNAAEVGDYLISLLREIPGPVEFGAAG